MTDPIEVTGPDEAQRLLEQFPHRVVLHPPRGEPDLKSPRLVWDPVAGVDEPPTEAMLLDLRQMISAGQTVVLSCADQRRRDYVVSVARDLGWGAGVPLEEPVTRH